ncbi:ABC transporter family substrate-binding protein [Jonesia denitrificans]|uniref:Extracellular solute-binding protein family 5 n=1 Tax=Jonesia denitrificans (strain ATCC 14870 / DSM 20603 / BCRC 15368 / CIP 55.134 / JCM 11481 / NBRC 15587 / NCTC 10816 / Prevot 55134) TaxID=471856 RepID=C7R1X9_JONDD|nr:ABC transporter family substrate-binding protein [Jonesia denitrificans]ACV08447.1 extracellular solute-binding protein family 5 [Jonesia denitrificans DSM 20603]ASE07908.1 ABC transporter substrate-binding protein [Jonesia denitrificans]QXB42517.1 ABC transporter family substrate-binding protein [Jonesia denitrificans]SQH20426.1 Oligopeptide-binding protein AppA precursor [Jonesia denitrificans]
MKIRKMAAPFAVLMSASLVLAACGTSEEPEQNETTGGTNQGEADTTGKVDLGDVTTKEDTIYYSLGGEEWLGFNGNTPETYSTYNSVINERLIEGFMYYGTDGTVYQNEQFGNFRLVSEDPMVVEYTINDNVTWSDGEPVAYEDYLLEWAAQAIADGEDEEGNPKPLFNHVGGLDFGGRTPAGPQGEPGGKTFTFEYENPYPDYQLQVNLAFPAHIVAEQAGMTLDELVTAIQDKDVEALRPAAKFWNEGWLSPNPGELPDEAIVPVNGPYKLSSWERGQSVTLEANENYWGTPPATKTLVYRFVAPEAQVQALRNGDLHVIEPQADVDTVAQIGQIGDTVTMATGQSLTWEHLDFNFIDGNEMGANLALREAFAMCVPRQDIVDKLIKPVDSEAVVMNAREVFPFQANYDEVVSEAYDGRYDEVDIDGAKAKLAEAGVETPFTVRLGYSQPNARRDAEFQLIQESCNKAGFDVQNVAGPDFFSKTLPNGDYDVAMYAWAGSGQVVSGQNIYSTKGQQNYGKYSSEAIDIAWEALSSTLDTSQQLEQVKVIEKNLWDDLYGIPLFAHPGVTAYDSSLQNVRRTATQSTVAWNAEQWVRAE